MGASKRLVTLNDGRMMESSPAFHHRTRCAYQFRLLMTLRSVTKYMDGALFYPATEGERTQQPFGVVRPIVGKNRDWRFMSTHCEAALSGKKVKCKGSSERSLESTSTFIRSMASPFKRNAL